MDRDDGGVRDARGGERLALEAAPDDGVAGERLERDLDRHEAVKGDVAGEKDAPHRAGVERSNQLVVGRDRLAQRRLDAHRGGRDAARRGGRDAARRGGCEARAGTVILVATEASGPCWIIPLPLQEVDR